VPAPVAQILGRAVGLVDVEELRHAVGVDRDVEAGGLLDHHRHVVEHRHGVGAVGVGADDLAAVGDQHAFDARLVGLAHAVAAEVVEHHAGGGVGGGTGHRRRHVDGALVVHAGVGGGREHEAGGGHERRPPRGKSGHCGSSLDGGGGRAGAAVRHRASGFR